MINRLFRRNPSAQAQAPARISQWLTLVGLLALITACSSTPLENANNEESTAADTNASVAKAAKKAEKKPEEPARPFDLQTLYSLLSADIAAQRDRYDVALRNYLRQAAATDDPGVARHATLLAELLRAEAVALRASEMWAKASPGDSDALKSAAIHQARARDLDWAMAHMTGALELGGTTQFTQLANSAATLTHAKKEKVLQQMQTLSERHPENAELWLALATLEDSLGQTDEALLSVRKSEALAGPQAEAQQISAVILESQLLEKLNRSDEAIALCKRNLEQFDYNKRLHLQYARLLTRSDMQAAQAEFEKLAERHPKDYELHFTLALVYRENQQLEEAENLLTKLLEVDDENPSVHYYLGLVYEDQGRDQEALKHYAQVGPGRVYLTAQARYADILSQRDQLDEALAHLARESEEHANEAVDLALLSSNVLSRNGELEQSRQLLSTALENNPDNKDLLYARSMLNEKLQDLPAAENDLRQVLAQDPENAAALNALGYTLVVHTERLDEALELIQKAYDLKPDDPAIMDSMGWVHFQLGNLETALEYLRKAHALFPDPEVAAHLGEALWAAGEQAEAKTIWRAALQSAPDNTFLLDIIERFGQP